MFSTKKSSFYTIGSLAILGGVALTMLDLAVHDDEVEVSDVAGNKKSFIPSQLPGHTLSNNIFYDRPIVSTVPTNNTIIVHSKKGKVVVEPPKSMRHIDKTYNKAIAIQVKLQSLLALLENQSKSLVDKDKEMSKRLNEMDHLNSKNDQTVNNAILAHKNTVKLRNELEDISLQLEEKSLLLSQKLVLEDKSEAALASLLEQANNKVSQLEKLLKGNTHSNTSLKLAFENFKLDTGKKIALLNNQISVEKGRFKNKSKNLKQSYDDLLILNSSELMASNGKGSQLQDKVSALQNEIDQLNKDNKIVNSDLEQKSAELAEKVALLETSNLQVNLLKHDNSRINSELTNNAQRLSTTVENNKAHVTQLNTQLAELNEQANIRNLSHTKQTFKVNELLSKASTQLKSKDVLIDQLDDQVVALEGDILKLNQSNQGLSEQLVLNKSLLIEKINDLEISKNELEVLNQSITTITNKHKLALISINKERLIDVEEFAFSLDSMQNHNNDMLAQNDNRHKKQLHNVQVKITTLENEKIAFENELATNSNIYNSYEQQQEAFKSEIATLQITITSLKTRYEKENSQRSDKNKLELAFFDSQTEALARSFEEKYKVSLAEKNKALSETSSINIQLDEYRDANEANQIELDELTALLDTKILALKDALFDKQVLAGNVSTLRSSNNFSSKQADILRSEVNELTGDKEQLSKQLKSSSKDISSLQVSLNNSKSQINHINASFDIYRLKHEKNIDDLRNKYELKSLKLIATNNQSSDEYYDELIISENKLSEAEDKKEQLQLIVEQLDADFKNLVINKTIVSQRLAILSKENGAQASKLRLANDVNKQLNNKVQTLESMLVSAESTVTPVTKFVIKTAYNKAVKPQLKVTKVRYFNNGKFARFVLDSNKDISGLVKRQYMNNNIVSFHFKDAMFEMAHLENGFSDKLIRNFKIINTSGSIEMSYVMNKAGLSLYHALPPTKTNKHYRFVIDVKPKISVPL